MSKKARVVVLLSGSGSNLQAILDYPTEHYQVVGVLSNKADAFGLIRAERANIDQTVIRHKDYDSRLAFDQALMARIDQWQPDIVVLAGFMRILTPEFVHHYLGRLINIHPSLLPKYPGLDTHARALANGDQTHGATVHFVTPELDAGPAIIQAQLTIGATDDTATLQARVHKGEHKIYPVALDWLASGYVSMDDEQRVWRNDMLDVAPEKIEIP